MHGQQNKKKSGVVLTLTFYFIFYIYFILFSLFLSHFICFILVSTHKHCVRKCQDKENYNSTYEIVQMRLL